jgi:hypothetical protein
MAMLNQILDVQIAMTDRLAQGGFTEEALEMVPKINMTAIKLAESAGIKNPDQFYLDIKPEKLELMKQKAANPPPSPEMMKIQADTQMKQQELQMRGQELMANAEIDKQADERKAQIESVQAQADIATEQRKLEGEMALAQQKFELERELKLMDFQLKREMHQQDMAMKAEQHRQQMEAGVFKTIQGQEAHDQKMEAAKSAQNQTGEQ